MKPVNVDDHLGEASTTTASAWRTEHSPKAAIGFAALLDQAGIATHFGGNYGLALALVAGSVAIIIAVLTSLGDEAKGCRLRHRSPLPTSCHFSVAMVSQAISLCPR